MDEAARKGRFLHEYERTDPDADRPIAVVAERWSARGHEIRDLLARNGVPTTVYERGSSVNLEPQYLDNTMVFLFETQLPIRPTKWALETELLERDYYKHWQGLKKHFPGK